ncbi:MAG TPA: FHA domain-containing protein [Polyangia bacterium]
MIDDGSPLSLSGIKAAAAAGKLPALARKLVAERRWSSLDILINAAATPALPLRETAPAIITLCAELAELPSVDQREAYAELSEVQLHAAAALARASDQTPMTEVERQGLTAAAALFAAAREPQQAAVLYEKAGADESAAELWGALGDLDRMEAALARHGDKLSLRRRRREARAQFDALFAAGERRAAIEQCLQLLEPGAHRGEADLDPELQQLATRARRFSEQLCRGHSLTLKLSNGRQLRIAETPAVIGRDRDAELPLREPTVSRRHACFRAGVGALTLEDNGSRTGTSLSGFPLAGAVPLRGEGDIELGLSCRLRFVARAETLIELSSEVGLDRGFWAMVGPPPIDLGAALGFEGPLFLEFTSGVARLLRTPAVVVRVGGKLIGPGCDLLRGDLIEVAGLPPWEVG